MIDYVSIGAALLGAAIGGIIGFVGTYWVQKQLLRREDFKELRNKIYGPMFQGISRAIDAVKSLDYYGNAEENLKNLKDDWLFSTILEGIKGNFNNSMVILNAYQKVKHAAEIKLNEVGHSDVMDASGLDIAVNNVFLNLLIGAATVSSLDLSTAIFLRLTPEDFIRKEKTRWGQNAQVEARFSGVKTTKEQYESLYVSILAKIEKEPLFQEEYDYRKQVIAQLELTLRHLEGIVQS